MVSKINLKNVRTKTKKYFLLLKDAENYFIELLTSIYLIIFNNNKLTHLYYSNKNLNRF